ncbi:MAG: glycolate oxidase subunit GlcE [Burkholderiales bacterium]
MQEILQKFSATLREASAKRTPVRIRGSGSKDFYGQALIGEVLDTRAYTGIVDYEPTELVITACAGTPLRIVETALADKGQMLAFEPAHFGSDATLGGCVASGFSGPRRAYSGSVRDFVLGVRLLNGLGEDLRFGGQVMKNVAGYDVSRLVTASFGTLGLLAEISLKVLPLPKAERTLQFSIEEAAALERINRWAAQPLPLSASCHVDGRLYVRLSGAAPAVDSAARKLGGETMNDGAPFWASIREHQHRFFAGDSSVWRMSVKSTAPPLALGPQLSEWNGSLRWILAGHDAPRMHEAAAASGGHATLFRGADKRHGIQRLSPGAIVLHRKLKHAFDPAGILCPGRLHPDF